MNAQKNGKIEMSQTMSTWPEADRRINPNGRRHTDRCAEHCILVKQWEEKFIEIKSSHERDQKETNIRLKNAAPLWAVIALITIVAGSVAYTFKTSADLQSKVMDKINNSNQSLTATLGRIQTDLEVAKMRQIDIKGLLEKYIQKYEEKNK